MATAGVCELCSLLAIFLLASPRQNTGQVVDLLQPYVHPSVVPSAKLFGCLVCVMINLSFFFIQTYFNIFSYIEYVHLFFLY